MSKIIYILFLIIVPLNVTAHVTGTFKDSLSSIQSKIDIKVKIETNSASLLEPIFSNSRIFITDKNGFIACYDTLGNLLWKNDSFGNIISLPAEVDEYLVSGTSNGDIIELKSSSGTQVQSIGLDDSITTGITQTNYNGDNELAVQKSTNSKAAIVFGTASGKTYCYDVETLQEYWHNTDAHKKIRFNPVITDTKIIFSCMDGYIYCIESGNGLMTWRWKESAETGFYNT